MVTSKSLKRRGLALPIFAWKPSRNTAIPTSLDCLRQPITGILKSRMTACGAKYVEALSRDRASLFLSSLNRDHDVQFFEPALKLDQRQVCRAQRHFQLRPEWRQQP